MTGLWRAYRDRLQPQGGARSLEAQMTKHSPHKRYKGHCPLCGHYKGNMGDTWHVPWPVLRKLGIKRRYRSSKVYGDEG